MVKDKKNKAKKEIVKIVKTHDVFVGFWVSCCILAICIIVLIETWHSDDDLYCYELHKQECLDCHSLNKTYLLCSGFCVEPEESDIDLECAFHPSEDCSTIPKMCVT